MKKLISKKKVKKCYDGQTLTQSPKVGYGTYQTYQNLSDVKQQELERLALQQQQDIKSKYGDDVPEQAKYLYDMGLLDEIEITADKNTGRSQIDTDNDWRNWTKNHPEITVGSDEYNRMPTKAKAQIHKNNVTNAINKAALPTAAAIIAPTALTAGAASLVGSLGTANVGNAVNNIIKAKGIIESPESITSSISQISSGNIGQGLGNLALTGLYFTGGWSKGANWIKNSASNTITGMASHELNN